MNEPKEHPEDQNSIRKLLKELPKVEASADFEKRLEQRIAGDPALGSQPGWFGNLLGSHRIPAFGYSLATLVLVGVVSYYAFFRSGTVPMRPVIIEREQTISPSGTNSPQPPEGDEQLKPSGEKASTPQISPAPKVIEGGSNATGGSGQSGKEEFRNEARTSEARRDMDRNQPAETGA